MKTRKARDLHQRPRFGDLEPRFKFLMNPYRMFRFAHCPNCHSKCGQRKVPLLIHVDPRQLIALNYTCRFCPRCDLLIAHKDEIEHLLHGIFSQLAPEAIGNDYLVVGTVEKSAWRRGLTHQQTPAEVLPHVHDFKEHFAELRMTQAGWFPADREPPVMEPLPSEEWIQAAP